MLIPYEQLESETLSALLQAHALQEGTEYGEYEVSLHTKIEQLKKQLEQKKVVIVYDVLNDSCNIISQEKWQELATQQSL